MSFLFSASFRHKGGIMKKWIGYFLLVTLLLSGCAYHKQTLLTVGGEEVNVPLGPLEGIKGKGLKAIFYRAVSIAFPAKEAIKELKDVKTKSGTNADGSTSSIDITQ